MATTSFTALRKFAGIGFALLFSFCMCVAAAGQGASPLVATSAAVGLGAPPTYEAVWDSAITGRGDFVIVDFEAGAVYQYPAGGGPVITVFAAGKSGPGGGWANSGVAIDPWNNLWLGNNWSGGLARVPWNPATGTWNVSAATTAASGFPFFYQSAGLAINASGTFALSTENGAPKPALYSFTIDSAGNTSNLQTVIATLTGRARVLSIDNAGNIFIWEDGGIPAVIEVPAGTTGLTTDLKPNQPKGTVLPNPPLLDVQPTVVDPTTNKAVPFLSSISGMTIDAAGNLYVGDSSAGVFMVPNQNGTLNPAAWVMITPTPADGQISIDQTTDTLFIPTGSNWNGIVDTAKVSLGNVELGSSNVGVQSSTPTPVYLAFSVSNPVTLSGFIIQEDGAKTPDFTVVSGGSCAAGTTYPIAITATAPAVNDCTLNVALNPQRVGSLSAQLLVQSEQAVTSGSSDYSATASGYSVSGGILTLQGANGFVPGELITISAPKGDPLAALNSQNFNVLGSGLNSSEFEIELSDTTLTGSGVTALTATGKYTYTIVSTTALHGTGLGAAIETTPALESSFGSGLVTPGQVATDVLGNVFVADAGLGEIVEFPAGSSASATGVSVVKGLVAPTGVAVDGNGDVFIADSTNVYEVPSVAGTLNTTGQITLATGLGANLRLAVDGLGHLYVADPANARVVELYNLGGSSVANGQSEIFLTTGFTAPSYVAVDSSNNLYVIDGANLFELSNGSLTTLSSTLSNATSVAIDPSGAAYISSTGGTVRIPSQNGVLNFGNSAAVAVSVTNPAGVALDNLGNLYLADGTALNIHMVSTNATLVLPTPATLTSSTSAAAAITNSGNVPLTVTGYTSTNAVDYLGSDVSCISASPIAPGTSCNFDITFDPGPGEQGTLAGQVGVQSNAINTPVFVETTGVGLPLAGSVSSITVGSSPEVINTPVTVTVKAASGTGIPTGEVTVSYTSWVALSCPGGQNSVLPCLSSESGILDFPNTVTATSTLTNGSASFNLSAVMAGNDSFTVAYNGDRVFGRSTATTTAKVAKSAITALVLPPTTSAAFPYLPLVLEANGSTPYSGMAAWTYSFTVTVSTAAGIPTGTITFMDQYQAGVSTTLTTGQACPASGNEGAPTLDLTGKASLVTTCLPMPQNVSYTPITSTHIITPVYSGDTNFLPYSGQVATTFIAVRSPAVAITAAPASVTVKAGSSTSTILTLNSVLGYGFLGAGATLNDYQFPVALSCSNLPAHTTCTFTYSPDASLANYGLTTGTGTSGPATAVNIICTGTVAPNDDCAPALPVTVTINTDVAVGTTVSQISQTFPFTYAAMFGFGIFGLVFRRRIGKNGQMILMLVLVLIGGAMATSLTACSTTNLSTAAVLTTPASGSAPYQVIITAQQVGSQVVTPSGGHPTTVYGSQNQVSLPFTLSLTVQ